MEWVLILFASFVAFIFSYRMVWFLLLFFIGLGALFGLVTSISDYEMLNATGYLVLMLACWSADSLLMDG